MKFFFIIPILIILTACSPKKTPQTPQASLSGFFDCVRINNKVLISAHRGGPTKLFPENSLQALINTASEGFTLLEIDVQQSRDGVLFLYHDRELGRTSTGEGVALKKNWKYLENLNLKLQNGQKTNFKIPKLEEVLIWAKSTNVILQIDIKPNTSEDDILSLIQKTKTTNRAMLIAYTLKHAQKWQKKNPNVLLSLGINSQTTIDAFLNSGVGSEKIIAWTGLGQEKPQLYKTLSLLGIESVAGTMGAVDLDISKTKNYKKYLRYQNAGVTVLATGQAQTVRKSLTSDNAVLQTCSLPN